MHPELTLTLAHTLTLTLTLTLRDGYVIIRRTNRA